MKSVTTSLKESTDRFKKAEIKQEFIGDPFAESKQDVIGDHTWGGSQGDHFKLEKMTITLFRAPNDTGSYKSYLTFSAFKTSLGWSSDNDLGDNTTGLFLYCKLLTINDGVVLEWDIPRVDINCNHNDTSVFFQRDNVDPDIYDLVDKCTFGQLKGNVATKC
jgi:hypothetical protein